MHLSLWKAANPQWSNDKENVTIWWSLATNFISSTSPHFDCYQMNFFWVAQYFVWFTCAWVLLVSLQGQHHGPQRLRILAAFAARDKLRGWFYGEESEGKACLLSVQGLQWPFPGLSVIINKHRINWNGNQAKLYTINTERSEFHSSENTIQTGISSALI